MERGSVVDAQLELIEQESKEIDRLTGILDSTPWRLVEGTPSKPLVSCRCVLLDMSQDLTGIYLAGRKDMLELQQEIHTQYGYNKQYRQ